VDIQGSRTLIAGATGELGSALSRALDSEGAELALVGRNAERLRALGDELDTPIARLDVRDAESSRTAVDAATAALGGLDCLIVSIGVPGFGRAGDASRDQVRTLFEVNALGPMELIEAALPHLNLPGAVVGVSAVVAEHPAAGIGHYSAAKAAFSAYLAALRRERRRDSLAVIDVRPPHLDTQFTERALFGQAPELPEPLALNEVVAAVLDALREDRREVAWDLEARELITT
jgi:short-subunit dehydrogenase